MSHFFSYKNTPIQYASTGKGPVIVLLHGFLENSTMWDEIIPFLSNKNRVISIDLLGHGASGNIGYVHTMEQQAMMVKAVLNHLKLRRFTLIGHSMGGYVGLSFAELFPNSVRGLCLMNSTFEEDSDERKLLRTRANKMVKTNYENMVRMSFVNLFSENSKTIHENEISLALKEALKTSLQGYIAANQGMKERKNHTSFYKNATCKKLVILGKNDTVLDSKTIQLFANKNKVPAVAFSEGHMSHIENKPELIEALIEFCK
ncbi:MAG: pimeloyl-ACP methyl ester carboxylesterase [Saprospiraceae bacterium]|jgi:pimeloyl-ACP methyl ester carboxylesterase